MHVFFHWSCWASILLMCDWIFNTDYMCCSVLTRMVAPLMLFCHHHHLFCRLRSAAAPPSGCRHGDKGLDLLPSVLPIMFHSTAAQSAMSMMARGNCFTYASSAWIFFLTADNCQKITAFIRCSRHLGFCSSWPNDFNSLCDTTDSQLFAKIYTTPPLFTSTSVSTGWLWA